MAAALDGPAEIGLVVPAGPGFAEPGTAPRSPPGARVSLPYTVFYELDGDQITVLRAYLSIAALVAQLQPANSMAGDR